MTRDRSPKRYLVTATWPNPRRRPLQVKRSDKHQARHVAEDLELQGAHVVVVEWGAAGSCELAVLDAFGLKPSLPNGATDAEKLAAVRLDLAALAAQAPGRRALR